jgi:hypothetical protein
LSVLSLIILRYKVVDDDLIPMNLTDGGERP